MLSKLPIEGFKLDHCGCCVKFELDELKWEFTVSQFGSLTTKVFEDDECIKHSVFGLYPQFKEPKEAVLSFRQHVSRTIGLDWRKYE